MNGLFKKFLENCNDEENELEELCVSSDISIRCVSKDVPKHLQWLHGWIFTYDGKTRYTSGGVTKREIISHILAKRKAKIEAPILIRKQLFF